MFLIAIMKIKKSEKASRGYDRSQQEQERRQQIEAEKLAAAKERERKKEQERRKREAVGLLSYNDEITKSLRNILI